MKYKSILLIMILFSIVFIRYSYAAQFEGFNYFSDSQLTSAWVISGNDTANGGSALLTTSTTEKMEGNASAKLVYNYSGNAYYQMDMALTIEPLSHPLLLDLSTVNHFSLWIYSDSSTNSNLIWYIRFYTVNGYVYRYVDWSGLGFVGWKKMEFDLCDMECDYWIGSYLDNPIINKVNKIQICFQQVAGVTGAGTATLYLDDMQISRDDNYIATRILDDFNYPTTDALTTAWTTTIPSGGYALTISTSANGVQGTGAMKMDYTIVNYWTNIRCEKTLPTTLDLSNDSYVNFWVYGDLSNQTTAPVSLITFQDDTGNRIWAHVRYGIKTTGWYCYWVKLQADETSTPSYMEGPFWQDAWDAGGNCDLSHIRKIGIYTQGGVQDQVFSFTSYIDELVTGYRISPTAVPRQEWMILE